MSAHQAFADLPFSVKPIDVAIVLDARQVKLVSGLADTGGGDLFVPQLFELGF